MVKRIIGYIFAVATVVVIVFTVMGAGSYKTMLSEDFLKIDFSQKFADDVAPAQAGPSAESLEQESVVEEQVVDEVQDVDSWSVNNEEQHSIEDASTVSAE